MKRSGSWSMLEIVSRKEAKARGLKRYFAADVCLRGHIAERNVCNGRCVTCSRMSDKKFRLSRGKGLLPRGRPRLSERMLAMQEGRNRYFTGKPCAHGHVADRFVRKYGCVECKRNKRKKLSLGRKEQRRKNQRSRYERNKSLGLRVDGKPRRREILRLSKEERRVRALELHRRRRAALRVLSELGIQI
jgi:hypothetical protein